MTMRPGSRDGWNQEWQHVRLADDTYDILSNSLPSTFVALTLHTLVFHQKLRSMLDHLNRPSSAAQKSISHNHHIVLSSLDPSLKADTYRAPGIERNPASNNP